MKVRPPASPHRWQQEKQPESEHHDQGIEQPTDRPGEGDEVSVVRYGFDQTICRKGVERVHAAGEEQRHADDGRGHIALDAEVDEGQNHREECRAERSPLQDGVGEGARKPTEHGVLELLRGHGPGPASVEAVDRCGEVHSQQVQNTWREADDDHCPDQLVRDSAYFGENGHLFRSQSGHLSERSDAGCGRVAWWPL
jgi:hypothetical protein